jgi:hypothetical protein
MNQHIDVLFFLAWPMLKEYALCDSIDRGSGVKIRSLIEVCFIVNEERLGCFSKQHLSFRFYREDMMLFIQMLMLL